MQGYGKQSFRCFMLKTWKTWNWVGKMKERLTRQKMDMFYSADFICNKTDLLAHSISLASQAFFDCRSWMEKFWNRSFPSNITIWRLQFHWARNQSILIDNEWIWKILFYWLQHREIVPVLVMESSCNETLADMYHKSLLLAHSYNQSHNQTLREI